MVGSTSKDSLAWALVGRQHGIITRRQLLELGFSSRAIEHRVARGRLRVLWRGVYLTAPRPLTHQALWMAAAMACGPGALLSHRSAAELWRSFAPADTTPQDLAHVTSPTDHRKRGIVSHRRQLRDDEATNHFAIPVTTPICTLVDVAPGLSRRELEGATSEADKLGLIDPEALREALDGVPPRPGLPKLRDVIDRASYVMTDTELERRFLPIARRAGLPLPRTQVSVNGFRVDFYWPELGLVVETDGLRYHRTPAQQAEDRRRDQAHTAAGLVPLRFTRAQVRFEPGHVEEVLRAVARRLLAG
jgi:very-short-patch-repair endonuclease